MKRNAKAAITAIKKGDFEKSLQLICATLIEKFEEDGWKTAKVQDLISMMVLLRGAQIKDEQGVSPVDQWLVSVKKAPNDDNT
jgi:hypothetical protein|tara:strand:+ start:1352 stop:1600 length:249 start_codon:yes stop_codon:yes gene_type:complete